MQHLPVLLNEATDYLISDKEGIYIDATFGAGGYTKKILQLGVAKVIAFDKDTTVTAIAEEFKKEFGERFEFYNFSYDQFENTLQKYQHQIAGIVYDLGVSSMQIDRAERGFSFQKDGPLDMRMDQRESLNAFEIINNYSQEEIARIIYFYGDEKKSRSIARNIVAAREIAPINTTMELVKIIQKATGFYRSEINPATRTFQALRIEVNKELQQLKSSLQQAINLLNIKGRLVVVSFHSGEDKIIKSFFNDWCGKKSNLNKYLPPLEVNFVTPKFKFLHKGTIIASKKEIEDNVRSRSAKLRAIEKIVF